MKVLQKIGRYFLAGVFSLLPLVITVAVAIWFTGYINQHLGPGTQLVEIIGKKDADDLKGMWVVYCSFGGDKGAGRRQPAAGAGRFDPAAQYFRRGLHEHLPVHGATTLQYLPKPV